MEFTLSCNHIFWGFPLPSLFGNQCCWGPAPTWLAVAVLLREKKRITEGKENWRAALPSYPKPLQALLFSPRAEFVHSSQVLTKFPADSWDLSTPEKDTPTKIYHSHQNKPFSFYSGLEFKRRPASQMQTFLSSLLSDVASSKQDQHKNTITAWG